MADRLTTEELEALIAASLPAPCPACGAEPGRRCWSDGPMPAPHPVRGRGQTDPTTAHLAVEVLELRTELARLRAAALRDLTAAWNSGYTAGKYDREEGFMGLSDEWSFDPASYLDEVLWEMSDE